jgi:ribose 5-phosphate isomerase A
MDFRQSAAAKAMDLIRDQMVLGLGGGRTIATLVGLLKDKAAPFRHMQLVTSSKETRRLLEDSGFSVLETSRVKKLDLYIDGCDQMDKDFNLLKSTGGIHTQEKLLASMAKEFVVLLDRSKYRPGFDFQFPLTLEVLPEAAAFVQDRACGLYPGLKTTIRIDEKTSLAKQTANGNWLIDLRFGAWPPLFEINPKLNEITGVVETSLFYQMANRAIVAGESGVEILKK